MDTRSKIIDAGQAARIAESGATVVSGYFDPMVASHAERLAALKPAGQLLLILITTPPDPILSARARAELVAGLAVVDYVCDAPDGVPPHISLDREHAERLTQLIGQVHARQRAAS